MCYICLFICLRLSFQTGALPTMKLLWTNYATSTHRHLFFTVYLLAIINLKKYQSANTLISG